MISLFQRRVGTMDRVAESDAGQSRPSVSDETRGAALRVGGGAGTTSRDATPSSPPSLTARVCVEVVGKHASVSRAREPSKKGQTFRRSLDSFGGIPRKNTRRCEEKEAGKKNQDLFWNLKMDHRRPSRRSSATARTRPRGAAAERPKIYVLKMKKNPPKKIREKNHKTCQKVREKNGKTQGTNFF